MLKNTMRAVRFYQFGGPEQLLVEQVPSPQPQAGEVLLRVYATGVNPIDWKIRQGLLPQPGRIFPLEEARQAQALSETGHGRGRIILHVCRE